MNKLISLCICAAVSSFASFSFAETLAYWRFENGPVGSVLESGFSVLDISGNGNHLAPGSEGGDNGYFYNSNVADEVVRATGEANNFSIKNTGGAPILETRSNDETYGYGSDPSGIDVEAAAISEFTIEAIFRPETGGYRTIVGRDAKNVGPDSSQAALYLQIRPDDSIGLIYNDVTGANHAAISEAGMITGFKWSEDPQGETGRWYYVAAVSDGQTLSVYLANLTAGTDVMLVAEADLTGSSNPTMAVGTVDGDSWHAGGWSVGRGLYNGNKTDHTHGYIDEVRISDSPLEMSEFLVVPKGTVDINPLFDGADPSIIRVGDTAYIYPTSGYYRHSFVYYSTDMVNWQQRYYPVINFDSISWIPQGKHCWAPGILEKDSKYYFYYSVGPKPSYIGAAVASSPMGPFYDSGAALIADNGDTDFEAIDPMVFEDPVSGKFYMYFGGSAGSRLKVFEMNSDLLSLGNEIYVDNPRNFTEGAFMHYRDGIYHLTYSHGSYNRSSYSLYYCTSNSPIGPWDYHGCIMETEGWFKGPGHHSIMYNPAADQWYICYHRWNERSGDGPYSGSRSVCIDLLRYDDDGLILPVVQTDIGIGPVRLGDEFLADFNNDGLVGLYDISYLAYFWLSDRDRADIAPVEADGIVDMTDFTDLAGYWQYEVKE